MNNAGNLDELLSGLQAEIRPIVDFDRHRDRLFPFDFSGLAAEPDPEVVADEQLFTRWVEKILQREHCRYGIGGYGENRVLYQSKAIFGETVEARSLHLGTDIWGPAGTTIYCPLDGRVHSFAFNDQYGDYGATIILQHQAGGHPFFTLYGHLTLASIQDIYAGMPVKAGSPFTAFGRLNENGHWPPHLHFQLILDLGGREGDYPGVCKPSEKEQWLANSPDPDCLLRYTFKS